MTLTDREKTPNSKRWVLQNGNSYYRRDCWWGTKCVLNPGFAKIFYNQLEAQDVASTRGFKVIDLQEAEDFSPRLSHWGYD